MVQRSLRQGLWQEGQGDLRRVRPAQFPQLRRHAAEWTTPSEKRREGRQAGDRRGQQRSRGARQAGAKVGQHDPTSGWPCEKGRDGQGGGRGPVAGVPAEAQTVLLAGTPAVLREGEPHQARAGGDDPAEGGGHQEPADDPHQAGGTCCDDDRDDSGRGGAGVGGCYGGARGPLGCPAQFVGWCHPGGALAGQCPTAAHGTGHERCREGTDHAGRPAPPHWGQRPTPVAWCLHLTAGSLARCRRIRTRCPRRRGAPCR